MKNYIGACAIARDENYFIEEWVQYHAMIGVERFIVYDNESKVPLRETLSGYIECGLVQIYEIKGISPQQQAYQHCLDKHGDEFRWLAFIDIDEFIVLKKNENIHSLLACYEECAALAINWVMFGSNGYINNPPLPISLHLREIVDYKMPNSKIKSIVQPQYVERANLSPHFFTYTGGKCAVNELYIPVHGNNSPPSVQCIQLNHYIFRGQREYQNKVDRWHYNHIEREHESLWSDFFRHVSCKQQIDDSIFPVAAKLNRLMKFGRPEIFADLNDYGFKSKELFAAVDAVSEAITRTNYDLALKLIVLAEMQHSEGSFILTKLKAEILLFKGEVERAVNLVQKVLQDGFWWEGYVVLFYCYRFMGNEILCRNIKLYLKDLVKIAENQSAEVPESVSSLLSGSSYTNEYI
ncbi:glycosyltransferase family 92 protein [Maridesulfovibrio sp.]|uniref:glycosyltransferase family 92 protein n=1 Tax=Maridesulfovibrio sp. TaxID=2795000 RepID=UPI002AA5EA9B|nr:glycosyltransferase family 92 protein [Maridesulfovibrio sp.]